MMKARYPLLAVAATAGIASAATLTGPIPPGEARMRAPSHSTTGRLSAIPAAVSGPATPMLVAGGPLNDITDVLYGSAPTDVDANTGSVYWQTVSD